jgi:hypothetical protein
VSTWRACSLNEAWELIVEFAPGSFMSLGYACRMAEHENKHCDQIEAVLKLASGRYQFPDVTTAPAVKN